CFDELVALLEQLGYEITPGDGDCESSEYRVRPPEGRKAVFLVELVARGSRIPAVLRLVMDMLEAGTALCVPGNHDVKLLRKLKGRDVQIPHGLADSLAQLDAEPAEFKQRGIPFLDSLVS